MSQKSESKKVKIEEEGEEEEEEEDGDDDGEELDPRVQDELEKLNRCTDEINRLELHLEDANCLFRTLLTDSTHQLKAMSKKVGVSNIEKARPYYEALEVATKAQKECQSAATQFQRANGIHAAAKETIALAEQRFLSNSKSWQFDNAWQEMLNHATMKVMEAEKQKTESEAEHLQRAAFYTAAEQACQRLEKRLKKYVLKTGPYFEQKDAFNRTLEAQKYQVHDLQSSVATAKSEYAKSLHKLEEISESIHAQRKIRRILRRSSSQREPGVGAEQLMAPLPSYDLDECERGSLRSTVSGQSSSNADMDEDNSETSEVDGPPKNVTRTVSCPVDMVKNLSLENQRESRPDGDGSQQQKEDLSVLGLNDDSNENKIIL